MSVESINRTIQSSTSSNTMKAIFRKFHLIVGIMLLTFSSSFAYDFQVGDLYYNILSETDGTVEITRKNLSYPFDEYPEFTELAIPSEVTYNSKTYRVVSIGKNAFAYCRSLTEASVPNSVTAIGDWAFQNCSKLTSITLSSTLTSIGKRAFTCCYKLESIDIPATVSSIGAEAFDGCNAMVSANIPDGITAIEDNTFSNCISLASIIIPNSVTTIGYMAFSRCWNLKSVIIGNSVATIGSWAFGECLTLTSLTIGSSVTTIGESAFNGCQKLTSIDIPASVTNIEQWAFSSCRALTSIDIPDSVTSIGEYAFSYCSALCSVHIGSSVSYIGDKAFSMDFSLLDISVNEANPYFSSVDGVLCDKNVTAIICCPWGKESIIIPESITTIGDNTFAGCSKLTSVTIPGSVTTISNSAFGDCEGLQNIIVDEANPDYCSIDGVLYDKNLTTLICCPAKKESLTIPESVTTFGDCAFNWCTELTTVVIPDSVTYIGDAFMTCLGLETLTIGKSVESIVGMGFVNCSKLTTVYCRADIPPTTAVESFNQSTYGGTLYVPTGRKETYKAAKAWRNFVNIEEMDFSGIENSIATGKEPQITVDNGILRIYGIEGNESVLIYDMRGRIIYNGTADTIPVLSHGFYIIKVGIITAKFAI